MGPEWVAIIALIALFVVGTVLPINMGALAYVAAWLVGMYSLNLEEKDILAGVSGDLVLTLIGVTYLFAIARNNGTVDLIVRSAVKGVGGRVALIPWVMFGVTALLTAIGAASPAACAIIGPIALGFAGRYRISPLMMGMMVVHGAQGGGVSPISIYGIIVNSVMEDSGLPSSEITIFLASLVVNLILAAILFVTLGGRELMSRRVDADEPDTLDEDLHRGGATVPARGTGTTTLAGTRAVGVRHDQILTLIAFVGSPSSRWSSTRTSASSRSPQPSSWPCSPPSSTRTRSGRSPGPPSCSWPGSAPTPRSSPPPAHPSSWATGPRASAPQPSGP
jgi:hypothetical protein